MDQRTLGPTHLRVSEPEVLAAQLWSFVHGYITLELAELFAEFDDPVAQVLVPMGVNLVVGLGDERERAEASHEAAAPVRLGHPTVDGTVGRGIDTYRVSVCCRVTRSPEASNRASDLLWEVPLLTCGRSPEVPATEW